MCGIKLKALLVACAEETEECGGAKVNHLTVVSSINKQQLSSNDDLVMHALVIWDPNLFVND